MSVSLNSDKDRSEVTNEIKTVLVLTATVGEPQFEAGQESLRLQAGVDVESFVIRSLGKAEAHQVMLEKAHSACADRVLKLDGDMVLAAPDSMLRLFQLADVNGSPDRLSVPVFDWFTRHDLHGAHFFRPSAVTADHVEPLHTDRWLREVGGVTVRRLPNPVILHAPNPDLEQAVRYGLQRGLKLRTEGPRSPHWLTVYRLVRAARHDPAVERSACLAAIALVLSSEGVGVSPDHLDHGGDAFREAVEYLSQEDIQQHLAERLLVRFGYLRSYRGLYRHPLVALAMLLAQSVRRREVSVKDVLPRVTRNNKRPGGSPV
ncbi:hypothetical protein NHL50_05340 [Acidimicrobiia bacterium EGI L10123]|uniref:hypothetical protein n=1 Tax=Salinilacustrithrix flava TaxID=2957203 RepID=UPI003D7C17D1|nr:hypothetical protein [Acidimicrobiia bacterium EGI L10123]